MRLSSLFVAATVAATLSMTACESTSVKTSEKTAEKKTMVESSAKEMSASAINVFEIHHDGRINVFYDKATAAEFQQLGETSYRLTRIGSGPKGETVVFGLTKADKKKGANTPAAMMWDGKAEYKDFYGEMHKHNRIYVFSGKKEMDTVRQLGHPAYMYTEIGAGPKGETVVYVLNKDNKKKKPVDMIAKFNGMNK